VKTCIKCSETKPLSEFYVAKANKDGYRGECKQCRKVANAAYGARPETKARRSELYRLDKGPQRRRNLKWFYGITPEEFEALLESQRRRCAVCCATEPGGQGAWHVDHDHSCCAGKRACGKCVRGLLCSRCNPMIGMAKDDPAILAAAVAYLKNAGANGIFTGAGT